MKDKLLQIRVDEDFLSKLEYLQEINGLKTIAETVRKIVEKEVRKENQQKTGKWVDGSCSNCGCDVPAYIIDWKWEKDMDAKFCPQCGARMKNEH